MLDRKRRNGKEEGEVMEQKRTEGKQAAQERAAAGNPLGYAPIPGLLRKFAVPSIISLLVTAAYNITDQIFIGHVVGMLGNAATNVAFPVKPH